MRLFNTCGRIDNKNKIVTRREFITYGWRRGLITCGCLISIIASLSAREKETNIITGTIPHIVGVEFGNYENIRDELLAYMKNAISMCRKFEVWSVWLDDPDHDVQVRKSKAEELSEEDMAWIFNQKYFEHPQCLRMYRWQRG